MAQKKKSAKSKSAKSNPSVAKDPGTPAGLSKPSGGFMYNLMPGVGQKPGRSGKKGK